MNPLHEEQAFLNSLEKSNLQALRIQTVCGVLGQPFFAFLDYIFIHKDLFPAFVMMRGLCEVCYCIIFAFSFVPEMKRYTNFLGALVAWVTGWAIVVMVWFESGPTSGYYAGINIPILATGILFTWTWKWNLWMGLPIYIAYLVSNLLHPNIQGNAPVFISHNFFIVFTIAYITVAQHFSFRRSREIFSTNRALNQANHQLEVIRDRLQELDRVKNQFFANITHELRTPLTLILTPVEAILQGELGQFQHYQLTYFRSIRENGLRLLKLINDLLELSKLKDAKVRLRISLTPMSSFLLGITDIVKNMAERKHIQLDLQCEQVDIWLDRIHMERVLLNVLANALKFTPNHGRITIRCHQTEHTVEITVEDTGIGIPPEHLSRVFERFFQSDSSSTRQYGGTGIGLSLAKELVELHGGTIRAESVVGQGTSIILSLHKGKGHFPEDVLDRRQQENQVDNKRRSEDSGISEWTHQIVDQETFRYLDIDLATERRAVPREGMRFKEARLLLVEDNVELLRFLNTLLGENYEIYTAMDGGTAYDLALEKKPDLVVSDVMIPVMDGFALCKKIKTTPATMHVPIILLTARSKEEDRIVGLEQGADAYLSKPFSAKELRTLIREILKNRANTAKIVLRKRLDSIQLMSARMAHEIFNPLNMIKNAIDAMKMQLQRANNEEVSTKLQPFFTIAERAIPRIQHTVELMKQYSREGYTHTQRPVKPNEMIEKLLQIVHVPAEKQCTITFSGDTKRNVWCEPAEFQQALVNLVENAIDAIEQQGTVHIGLKEEENDIIIEIQDTGCGIAHEDIDRIFSPFFTTKGPGKGMGLGMNITLQAIESIGGEMSLRSEKGVGTLIILRIPSYYQTVSPA